MLIGIVGKPNCGKSTFFKASTLSDVLIANYPFATIKPNHGIGYVKIEDIAQSFANKKANPREGYILGKYRFVPVELLDVAGLVPDAHLGKGLGNQFLSDLNQADILIHVIDVSGSTNDKGEPVQALSYNPENDIKFLENELDYWYLDILKRGWDRLAKKIQQEHLEISKTLSKQLSGLKVTEDMVKEAIKDLPANPLDWNEELLLKLSRKLRIASKPMIIAANKIDVPGAEKNYKKIREDFPHLTIIPCSAESELALKEASRKELISYIPGENNFEIIGNVSEQQRKALEFIKENILSKFVEGTGIQPILNNAVFGKLKYIAIHPGGANKLEDSKGNVLPDCFLLPQGSTALDFAFRLHSDFGKNFIRAIDVKTKRVVGKDHKLNNLDILEIIV